MKAIADSFTSLVGGNLELSTFLFLVGFGFCTPIPEELALVVVGFAFQSAGLPYPAALAISLVALSLADTGSYCLARFLGPKLLRFKPLGRILGPKKIAEAERYFARRGPRFIFASRFIAGLRSAATLGAGFLRMPYLRFLAYAFSSLAVSAPCWLAVGFFVGSRFESMFDTFNAGLSLIGILAAITLAVFAFGRIAANRIRAEAGEA